MARGSRGDHIHIHRYFFARLHIPRTALYCLSPRRRPPSFSANPAAILSQCFSTANFIPSAPPSSSSPSARRITSRFRLRAGPFQRDHHRNIRDRHPLVVNRSASVHIAVLDHAAERDPPSISTCRRPPRPDGPSIEALARDRARRSRKAARPGIRGRACSRKFRKEFLRDPEYRRDISRRRVRFPEDSSC